MAGLQAMLPVIALISLTAAVGWAARQARQDQYAPQQRPVFHLVHLFYFVIIPYLTIVFGLIPPRLMGLTGAEYVALIDWNNPLFIQLQQTLTLVLLEWLFDVPTTVTAGAVALLVFGVIWYQLRSMVPLVTGQSTLEVLYFALHWAFYRAIFWQVTGDLYLGTIWGAALVMVEWVLISIVQGRPIINTWNVTQSIILVLTALVFFYSPNLWLLLPVHLLMVLLQNSINQHTTGIAVT